MPVQRTLFGRPISRLPPRRVARLLAGLAIFAVITLFFTLPNSIPTGPSLSKFTDDHHISIPRPKLPPSSILNPFRPAAHPPPVQANSTNGDSSWYSNWNWLSPFSSSVTLDENRSLLPPLLERPPIYTYYDSTLKKDAAVKAAEHGILLIWRKAWWAQGFKPVVLGPAEATNNALYKEVQLLQLQGKIQTEMMRWLAWENMGAGVLCHTLAFPMGSYEDTLLSYLRRGEYPFLRKFEGLGSGLLSGSKQEITTAIKVAIATPNLSKAKDLLEVLPEDTFKSDFEAGAIAFYHPEVVATKYAKMASTIVEATPEGLEQLRQLINAHLHNTWQNTYNKGIAVPKPVKKHMTAVLEPAMQLAKYLSQCPKSPVVSSCPPNRPHCSPCVATTPIVITTPTYYRNKSDLYTVGVVPHPFTTTLLGAFREDIDIPYIRRGTQRDQWLWSLTRELLGNGLSMASRIVSFKEAVASPHGLARSIWFPAEDPIPNDLDWHFGFEIPRNVTDTGRSETPVPGPERRPKPPPRPQREGPVPSENELATERQLLERARSEGKGKLPEQVKVRGAVEAWNYADAEVWKFTKAFRARATLEREKWEEEEAKYGGDTGISRGHSRWKRWID
ncbi:MAG: hypothetical protein M1818_005172 [Claussenomyces sp. TS43310]|nr:MAG: hypothetical protein M1818_005172 [Claussenomyces sp. TS43310]